MAAVRTHSTYARGYALYLRHTCLPGYLGTWVQYHVLALQVQAFIHTYLGTYVPALSSIACPIRQASPFLSAGHTSCLPLLPFSDLMSNSQS